MPKGIPLTDAEQARRRREIFRAAEHLFLENGFTETSMRAIAAAAGVGKSTLYDYYTTKDEILLSVIEDALHNLIASAREIAGRPIGAVERVRLLIAAHLDYLSANEEFYLKLGQEVQRISPASQAEINRLRHAYQDVLRGVIEEGSAAGQLRPLDALLTARIIISALAPAVFATRQQSSRTRMMADAVTLLLCGLIAD
jgi:TetR/AcrR family transcriptional regulator, cholesterol catabolism regulator